MEDYSTYYNWAKKICSDNNIKINGELTHIKDNKLFCVSTDIGDLYLKKTTSFVVDEIIYTLKLMEFGIISLPKWIGYNHEMKICLTQDMGGVDLSSLPLLDIETAVNMFVSLARIQKKSIAYVKSKDLYGFDYKIDTMLYEMKNLPETAYEMLFETQYKITREETEKLTRNIEYMKATLETIKAFNLPDTVHHGDLGAYNVRIVNKNCIFYDWGCGGVSHPFFDALRLLYSIRHKLPNDVSAKSIIIDTYISEWSQYGNFEKQKNVFKATNEITSFYMAYVKYIRARNLHQSYNDKPELILADGLGLDKRYETAAVYIREFIEYDSSSQGSTRIY